MHGENCLECNRLRRDCARAIGDHLKLLRKLQQHSDRMEPRARRQLEHRIAKFAIKRDELREHMRMHQHIAHSLGTMQRAAGA